jgi:hypothetical protein
MFSFSWSEFALLCSAHELRNEVSKGCRKVKKRAFLKGKQMKIP